MLMVKNRTELMQSILKLLYPDARSNMLGEAYFVGVLSLIDRIFSMPLQDILEHITTSSEVEAALLRGEGVLGEILTLIEQLEAFHPESASSFETKHALQRGILNETLLQSMQSVQAFESPESPKE